MASPPNTIEETIAELRGNMPQHRRMSIHDNGSSSRVTLMAPALDGRGLAGGDEVDEWYFPERGLVVIDLEGGPSDGD